MADALFISDLHLRAEEPGVVDIFLRFLAGPARGAGSLTILGDLFEYWAGDDDLSSPFNRTICAQIKALADTGVAVRFMRGNRDFLVGPAFAQASGVVLLDDPCVMQLAGEPVLLTHGDALCTEDLAYQAFRAQVRDPAWQAGFLAKPLAERLQLIQAIRAQSETEKHAKSMSIMDVNPDAVIATMRAKGVTKMIHGHTHRPARHVFEIDGHSAERWVLADWCAAPAFLAVGEGGFVVHAL
jgi:UDP-2,3-diacylglucosamine hydrolase